MKNISELLQRFKNLKVPNESIRKEFQRIIKERYGFEIDFEAIKYQSSKIFFQAPSVIKQEVQLDKKEIIDTLYKKLNIKLKNII